MVNIAILGYGTVGSGVVEVLSTNMESINKKAGKDIQIKYVLDLKEFPGTPVEHILTKNYDDILNDDSVKVIAEVMGGVEPAYTFVKQALLKGKSVVTSNKALVAKHGPELLEIAENGDVNFLFEASVGGGIPIIRPLNKSLTADEIYEITGILNGTTNFILTQMTKDGADFDEVLKEAQDKGYAEADPSADVDGDDACRKIAILSSLAFHMHVDFEDIYTEGIRKITDKDIAYAKLAKREIKLLATSKKVDDKVYARVAPVMLDEEHPLSNVSDVFNAIFVKGNVIGDVMFYGHGAGKLPTASAVVADIVDAVKHMNKHMIQHWSSKKLNLMSIDDVPVEMFIRAKTDFYSAAVDDIKSLFGTVKFLKLDNQEEEVAFISGEKTEKDYRELIKKLADKPSISKVVSNIRVQ